jgi:hypothetical protein
MYVFDILLFLQLYDIFIRFYLYFFASKHLKANNFLQFRLDQKSSIEQKMYTAAKNTEYIPECLSLVCIGLDVHTAPTGNSTNQCSQDGVIVSVARVSSEKTSYHCCVIHIKRYFFKLYCECKESVEQPCNERIRFFF